VGAVDIHISVRGRVGAGSRKESERGKRGRERIKVGRGERDSLSFLVLYKMINERTCYNSLVMNKGSGMLYRVPCIF
jgi:hypothetical protein